MEGWILIVTAVGGFLSALGFGGILIFLVKRYADKSDQKSQITDTNFGKKIDADQAAFQSIFERLEKTETKYEKVFNLNGELKVSVGQLESELKYVNKSLERSDNDLKRSTEDLGKEKLVSQRFEAKVEKLQTALNQANVENKELSNKIISSQESTLENVFSQLTKMIGQLSKIVAKH